jgi:hypothetical protein
MRQWLRNNGLVIAMTGLFAVFLIAQALTGWHTYNDDQRDHDESTVSLFSYLGTGHFVEATFENWESEFLQMGFYVVLTAILFHRGSSESKDPDGEEEVDKDPRDQLIQPDTPWPVRRRGMALALYEHSLSTVLFLLFFASFVLHLLGGANEYNQEQLAHGGHEISTWAFAQSAEFWFQSFQNWQSEFLAVASLSTLSIFLRQRGSPESKPVHAPHRSTGN